MKDEKIKSYGLFSVPKITIRGYGLKKYQGKKLKLKMKAIREKYRMFIIVDCSSHCGLGAQKRI
ncbi:MAG: hypothetical protein K6U80_05050 [Firmicutes bacterium]|nr:hypothetical protein [Bacillota bacterium]